MAVTLVETVRRTMLAALGGAALLATSAVTMAADETAATAAGQPAVATAAPAVPAAAAATNAPDATVPAAATAAAAPAVTPAAAPATSSAVPASPAPAAAPVTPAAPAPRMTPPPPPPARTAPTGPATLESLASIKYVDLPAGVVATVNGEPITWEKFNGRLLRFYGERAIGGMLQEVLIHLEAKKRGLTLSNQELEKALEDYLMKGPYPQGMPLSERRQQMEKMMKDRGISPDEFRSTLETEGLFKKIVSQQVNVTDEMINAEYQRRYGERLTVSQIVTATEDDAKKVMERLKAGERFHELAKAVSIDRRSANADGRVPRMITRGDQDPVMATEAFKVELGKHGEPFKVSQGWCILRVEARTPADKAKLEDVKLLITGELMSREENSRRGAVMTELFKNANIERSTTGFEKMMGQPSPSPDSSSTTSERKVEK